MITLDLDDYQVADILRSLGNKGKTRVDVMIEDFDISDIDSDLCPSDANENEAGLKKILSAGALNGWM